MFYNWVFMVGLGMTLVSTNLFARKCSDVLQEVRPTTTIRRTASDDPIDKLKTEALDKAAALPNAKLAGSEIKQYISGETDKNDLINFTIYLDSALKTKTEFKDVDRFVGTMEVKGYKWKQALDTCLTEDPTISRQLAGFKDEKDVIDVPKLQKALTAAIKANPAFAAAA